MEERFDAPTSGNREQRRAAARGKKAAALGSGLVLAAAGASTAITLASSAPAVANTPLVVDSLTDDGTGFTLREAIEQANSDAGQDTITFSVSGTITLTSDLPNITEALQIQGPGASALTVDGADQYKIFEFNGVTTGVDEVSGITLTNGVGKDPDNSGGAIAVWSSDASTTIANTVLTSSYAANDGGAIHAQGSTGTLVVTGTTVSGNEAGNGGGGLYIDASDDLVVTITDSVVTGNTAGDDGGGLYLSDVDATLTNVTVNFNTTDEGGGGIVTDGGSLHLMGSWIGDNTAANGGGGLYLYDTETTIEFSTITGNQANDGGGGGLYATDDSTDKNLTIRNSTISNNTAQYYGGGMYVNTTGAVVIENSTISGNTSGVNGGAAWVSDNVVGFTLTQSTVTNNTALKSYYGPLVGGILIEGSRPVPAAAEARKANRAAKAVSEKTDGKAKGAHAASDGVHAALVDPVEITGTILAGNVGQDIGTFGDLSAESDHSIVGNVENAPQGTVTVTDLGGSQIGVTDPGLLPLADNGGPTQTHALAVGSPAKDAGPNPVPAFPGNEFDQRGQGYARVVDGTVDVGAFEQQAPLPVDIAPKFTG